MLTIYEEPVVKRILSITMDAISEDVETISNRDLVEMAVDADRLELLGGSKTVNELVTKLFERHPHREVVNYLLNLMFH